MTEHYPAILFLYSASLPVTPSWGQTPQEWRSKIKKNKTENNLMNHDKTGEGPLDKVGRLQISALIE